MADVIKNYIYPVKAGYCRVKGEKDYVLCQYTGNFWQIAAYYCDGKGIILDQEIIYIDCKCLRVLRGKNKRTLSNKQQEKRLLNLVCSCCGKFVKGRQWDRRDRGYGVCLKCIDKMVNAGMTAEEIYHKHGILINDNDAFTTD